MSGEEQQQGEGDYELGVGWAPRSGTELSFVPSKPRFTSGHSSVRVPSSTYTCSAVPSFAPTEAIP